MSRDPLDKKYIICTRGYVAFFVLKSVKYRANASSVCDPLVLQVLSFENLLMGELKKRMKLASCEVYFMKLDKYNILPGI